MRKIFVLVCAALMLAASPAIAQPKADSVEQVTQRHIIAFDKHDVEGLMADYDENIVTVMSSQILHGKPAMRKFFTDFFASATMPKFTAKLDRVEGDAGVTLWVMNPGTPGARQGNDVFIIRNGKIVFQTTTNVKPVEPPKP
jgi:ketosteroid isomerase-like protein